MISSVLRVSDLRSWGVTIHLYVNKTSCLLHEPLRMLSLATELTATSQTYHFQTSCHSRRTRPIPRRAHP
jgi:hypothetical protein